MIEIRNLYKKYKMGKEELTVLKNVTLSIKEGEFTAIVGPSGSGKSTLMHIIGGLDKQTSGSVIIDRQDISSLNDRKMSRFRNEKIGFVFQSFNLESTLTALENVMIPLMIGRVSEKERKKRAHEALKLVELDDREKHKPTQMSGGQRQRVSIARAFVNNPKIILADEPTGNLDTKTGETIMEILKSFKKKGYTVIMVTHNMAEAEHADRVIKIVDGIIEEA